MVVQNNGDSIADANVLEFDFVPKSNHIRLEYVFASEEYGQSSCDIPNDVMGIFLNGPGIVGHQNIALVPGTATPVGLHSVYPPNLPCHPENPAGSPYYVDNSNGQNVVFNGFTVPLLAEATVSPCDTYHLRIGVADGAKHPGEAPSDYYYPYPPYSYNYEDSIAYCMGMYDSGIFLKNGSLRSTDSMWVEARGGDTLSPYTVRGCLSGSFRVHRTTATGFPMTLGYSLSGTAVSGQDYNPLPMAVTIPAGATFTDIPVTALTSGSGDKTLKLVLHSPYTAPCATMWAGDLDSATLNIDDGLYAAITIPDTAICQGCSVQLTLAGDPGLQYGWQPAAGLNDSHLQSPTATPTEHTHYFMTATQPSPGLCPPVKDSVWVYVGNVGIGNVAEAGRLVVAPNPFRESFRISVVGQNQQDQYQISIFDIGGHQLLKLQGSPPEKINQKLADFTPQLPQGTYLLKISKEKSKSRTIKVVKIK